MSGSSASFSPSVEVRASWRGHLPEALELSSADFKHAPDAKASSGLPPTLSEGLQAWRDPDAVVVHQVPPVPVPAAPVIGTVVGRPMRSRCRTIGQVFLRNGVKDWIARLAGGAVRSAVVAALAGSSSLTCSVGALGANLGWLTAAAGVPLLWHWSRLAGAATLASTLLLSRQVRGNRPLLISTCGQVVGAWATELARESLNGRYDMHLGLRAPLVGGPGLWRGVDSLSDHSFAAGRALGYVAISLAWLAWRGIGLREVLPLCASEIDNALLHAPHQPLHGWEERWLDDFAGEFGQATLEGLFAAFDAAVLVTLLQSSVLEFIPQGPDRAADAPLHQRVREQATVRFALDTLTLMLGSALLDPLDDRGCSVTGAAIGLAVLQGVKRLRAHATEQGLQSIRRNDSVASVLCPGPRPEESAQVTLETATVQVGPGSSLRRRRPVAQVPE